MKKLWIAFVVFVSSVLCAGILYADTWTKKADNFGGSERNRAVAFTIDGKGYLGTGQGPNTQALPPVPTFLNDFWKFDPAVGTWTQVANFGGTARGNAVGFAIGNKGYIGTGAVFSGEIPTMYNDFWEYDPAGNSWVQKAAFPGTARFNAAGFAIGNKGYIGTGSNGAQIYKDFYEYDPAGNSWTQKADFGGEARMTATGLAIGNKGYLGLGMGGDPPTPTLFKNFYEYDPAGNSWSRKSDFAGAARHCAVGFAIGTKGYIGTGNSGVAGEKDFYEYDPASDTWSKKTDFEGAARFGASAFAIDQKGYLLTGVSGLTLYKDFWEYSPGAALNTAIYATFTSYGLYKYDGTNWQFINSVNPDNMTTSGGVLYADFQNYGLYKYTGGVWSPINTVRPTNMLSSDGKLYATFAGYGFYKYDGATGWALINSVNPDSMTVSGGILYATFTGYGFYKYDGINWTQINSVIPVKVVAGE